MTLRALCFAVIAALFSAVVARAADQPQCSLKRVAELEVKVERSNLLVKVQLDDHDTWLQVDTASPVNTISQRLADEWKLPRRDITGAEVVSGNGKNVRQYVTIKKMGLAGMTAEDVRFLVMGQSNLGSESGDTGYQGDFGAEFLGGYDVELDIPHGKMILFSQDHCKGQVVYWTQEYVAIPFKLDSNFHISFPVTLDGRTVNALLDTSSSASLLSSQVAKRDFNFDPGAPGTTPDGELGRGTSTAQPYYLHRFASLDIGGVAFHNTELVITQDKLSPISRHFNGIAVTPMQIGLHHLGRLRAYIAYGEKVLYVSAADAH